MLLHDAFQYLDERYWSFFTNVLNQGEPLFTTEVPTAALIRDDEGKQFIAINPHMVKTLSVEEFAAVLAHETMHSMLDHLNFGKRFASEERFNIAADCVINDYLADGGMVLPEWTVNGENTIGQNTLGMTVLEVYHMLPEDQSGGSCECGLSLTEVTIDGVTYQASWEIAIDNSLPSSMTEDYSTQDSMQAGNTQGTLERFIVDQNVTLKWVELIRRFYPDYARGGERGRTQKNWGRRPRRIAGFRNTLLPSIKHSDKEGLSRGRKPKIVVALDVSSSVSASQKRKFLSAARSLPEDDIDADFITFDTMYYRFDRNTTRVPSGGGTNFSAIERYALTLDEYPSMIVVITDGYASFNGLKPKNIDSYVWLLDGGRLYDSVRRQCKKENIFRLNEMLK